MSRSDLTADLTYCQYCPPLNTGSDGGKQTFYGNMLLRIQMFKEILLLAVCFRTSTRISCDEDTITITSSFS